MKYITLFVTLISLAGCNKDQSSAKQDKPVQDQNSLVTLSDAQLKSAGLQTGLAESIHLSSRLKVSGTIDVPPQNRVSVSMPLGGYLKSSGLIPGMRVSKGQVIAIMEDPQYIQLQQDYLTALARLSYAEAELQRQKELNQSKASSDKVVQQMQMEYQTRKIEVGGLAEKLKLIHINPHTLTIDKLSKSVSVYSPIDGFVAGVHVNPGKYVNPSDVLFELVNPAAVHLSLQVYEKDLDKLSVGQKLVAYSNTDPTKKYSCTILLINRNLSAERAAEVHAHFENQDKTLVPGMFMNAEIEVKNEAVTAVKENAVVSFEGKDYVFGVKGKNKFRMIAVQTGAKEKGYVAIESQDSLRGVELVNQGAYTLLMALKNKTEE